MQHPRHSLGYYLNWIIIGLLTGLCYLLLSGDARVEIFGISLGDPAHRAAPAATSTGYANAVALTSPAVVSITARHTVPADVNQRTAQLLQQLFSKNPPRVIRNETRISSGSGVILDARGYVLTNYHVIADTEVINITLTDGRSAEATLVGKDPDTDIAVLKIELDDLPEAQTADINQLRIGDIVLAIGYPFEIGQTVTPGIISATGRNRVSNNTYENFLQTDAAINPGNSGGALINTEGEIVGINSLIYTRTGNFQGIGFAIPIDLVKSVLAQIIANGYVVRGWLGVEGRDLSASELELINLNNVRGILINSVDENGPGDKAGIRAGDIITHINKQPITQTSDIVNTIAAGKPGDKFEIEGIRQRQSFLLEATLGQRPLRSQ